MNDFNSSPFIPDSDRDRKNGSVIYNVTTQADHRIASLWLHWMKEEHIPEIIAKGCFTHAIILRLIEVDETQGPTFAIQYHAESKALYNQYIENFAEGMEKKVDAKWGSQVIAFRSVLQVVH